MTPAGTSLEERFVIRNAVLAKRAGKAPRAARHLNDVHEARQKHRQKALSLHPAITLEYGTYKKNSRPRDFVQILPTYKPEVEEDFKESIFVTARRFESPASLIRRALKAAGEIATALSRQGVLLVPEEVNSGENITR